MHQSGIQIEDGLRCTRVQASITTVDIHRHGWVSRGRVARGQQLSVVAIPARSRSKQTLNRALVLPAITKGRVDRRWRTETHQPSREEERGVMGAGLRR